MIIEFEIHELVYFSRNKRQMPVEIDHEINSDLLKSIQLAFVMFCDSQRDLRLHRLRFRQISVVGVEVLPKFWDWNL